MPKRRARRTQNEEEVRSPSLQRAEETELTGIEQGSAQYGVARLQNAAGNDAVSGMLQRFHDAEGMEAPERPSAMRPEAAAEEAAEGGRGGIGDQIQELVQDAASDAGIDAPRLPELDLGDLAPGEGPAQLEIAGGQDDLLQGVPAQLGVQGFTGGGGARASELRAFTLRNLEGADSATRRLGGDLADAIGDAWDLWQSTVNMVGAIVNAVTVSGGTVVGPLFSQLARPRALAVDRAAGDALSNELGRVFDIFAATLKLPGLPLFPAFGAFPGPVAPPTPSIPVPLLALVSVPPQTLKPFSGLTRSQRDACEAVVDAFDATFGIWRASTMVSLLGSGPVPTFAPPYVPVGPVVGGVANSLPGSFLQ